MKTGPGIMKKKKSKISSQDMKFPLLGILTGVVLTTILMVLFESFTRVLFSWPAIILSILILITGLLLERAVWVLAGAILTIPFALYLSATPRFRFVGIVLPLVLLAAAYAVQRGRRLLAWLFLLPYIAVTVWLAWSVLNQA